MLANWQREAQSDSPWRKGFPHMLHLTDRVRPNPLPHVSPGHGWHGHHRPKPTGLCHHLLGKPLPTTLPCVAYVWRHCWLCGGVGSSAHPTLGLDWPNFSHQHWKSPGPGAPAFVDRPGFQDWPNLVSCQSSMGSMKTLDVHHQPELGGHLPTHSRPTQHLHSRSR